MEKLGDQTPTASTGTGLYMDLMRVLTTEYTEAAPAPASVHVTLADGTTFHALPSELTRPETAGVTSTIEVQGVHMGADGVPREGSLRFAVDDAETPLSAQHLILAQAV